MEKQPSTGGNSAKASSGMSTLNAETGDSIASFYDDTMVSGKQLGQSDLVRKLVVSAVLSNTPKMASKLPSDLRTTGREVK